MSTNNLLVLPMKVIESCDKSMIIVIPTFQRDISSYSLHYIYKNQSLEPCFRWVFITVNSLFSFIWFCSSKITAWNVDRSQTRCFEVIFCFAFMDDLAISGSAGVNPCFRIYMYVSFIRFVTFVPRHLFV